MRDGSYHQGGHENKSQVYNDFNNIEDILTTRSRENPSHFDTTTSRTISFPENMDTGVNLYSMDIDDHFMELEEDADILNSW